MDDLTLLETSLLRIAADHGFSVAGYDKDTPKVEALRNESAELLGEHAAMNLDLDRLAGIGRPNTAGLIAELNREARERSLGCRVSVLRGDIVQRVIEVAEQDRMLIVTGCDTDPSSPSYRSVQAIIRCCRDPVLVV